MTAPIPPSQCRGRPGCTNKASGGLCRGCRTWTVRRLNQAKAGAIRIPPPPPKPRRAA